jgi:glycosyltransferase involved in cell wall biosynthesis
MRVLMLPPSFDAGGAERMTLTLAEARAAAGDDVVVAAPPGTLDPAPLPAGVRRFVLARGGRGPVRAARGAVSVARVARRTRPDLIHAHNPRAVAAAWLAARAGLRPRPPVVATYHGVPEADRGGAARVLARADEVVCVTTDQLAELERAGFRGGARVVPNGVAAAPELTDERRAELRAELGADEQIVTMVGRLVEQKAPERFVDAAAAVLARRRRVTFLLVGEGPLRPGLERRVRERDIAADVRFTGVRDDARDVIALSDLVVFTSVWEGLSIVALEALAASVPVVASAVSGMRELLGEGAGRIVEQPDSEAFAAAIGELLDDPAARAEMGERGRRLVEERYSARAMADGYAAAYASALERR